MTKRPEPAVGQVWESTDPRDYDPQTRMSRRMTIVGFEGNWALMRNRKTGRLTRINFHRLNNTLGRRGYRHVE